MKLILPEPDSFNPADYVRDKLVPLAGELQKLCNEFFNPGCTAEESIVDMMPTEPHKYFEHLDKRVTDKPKSVLFKPERDLPLFKGDKRLKILFSAIVYVKTAGSACFRLVNEYNNDVIEESIMQITNTEPAVVTRYLPYGNQEGRIRPTEYEYAIQAKYIGSNKCIPVCRRFSLTPVYI